ncbi:MAG: P-II family nitrogen regulator [Eubacteriales bacterium]|nr:P-II family nitrogen regulator [Eubacteriales bacterium]
MNYIISVVKPESLEAVVGISEQLSLPVSVKLRGRGTAVQSMLDLLGIESTEKRVLFSIADEEKTKSFFKELKHRLFIGVPGHGIAMAVPIKSIGGGKTLSYLNGGQQNAKYQPELNYAYELIVIIANEGRTDLVMNAAREAGATGGTVLHGKGTGDPETQKFLNVSLAHEKEVILIVAKSAQKSEIMRSILRSAGPSSEAGAITFSLPISEVAGFGLFED